MAIKIIKEKITKKELEDIAKEFYVDMVKAMVDIESETMAVGGELHSDASELLIKNGSNQENIWGINIYLDKPKEERIEFSSLINIRPLKGNRSIGVELPEIREKIRKIVDKLIE
jgi:hypothetical protein